MYCLDCKYCSYITGKYYESITLFCEKKNRNSFANPVEYYCEDFSSKGRE